MSCKDECFKNPKHPDNKCCFNCGRDTSFCDSLHVCGSDCCDWKPKVKTLIDIPADGNYIEILGHRIDGFESFEAFLEHLKKYVVLEETVKAQKAEIESKNDLIHRQSDVISEQKEKLERIYAEAVKEFAERLKERFLNLEYRANTTRKTLPIAFVKDQTDWIMHEVSVETIDNLVKEMVGES